jgi:hypothetical protein
MNKVLKKNDSSKFASFKEQRLAEKEARRKLLAVEFPLLFGADSKARSTIGKYANKATSIKKNIHPEISENNENADGNTKIKFPVTPSRTSKIGGKRKALSPKKSSSKQRQQSLIELTEQQKPESDFQFSDLSQLDFTIDEVYEIRPFEDTIQDQVIDCLEYMLSNNELDKKSFARLSKQSFSADTLRRLSMQLTGDAVSKSTNSNESDLIPVNSSNASAETTASPLAIDDLEILDALRVYVGTMENSPENIQQETVQTGETTTTNVDQKDIPQSQNETVDVTLPPNATTTESCTAASTVPETTWNDLTPTAADDTFFMSTFPKKLKQSNRLSTFQFSQNSRHSILDNTSLPHSEKIVIFPMSTVYMDAMARGLVHAEMIQSLHRDKHDYYVIRVTVLDLPGNPSYFKDLHTLTLKRFSEFKQFRNLLTTLTGTIKDSIPPMPSRQVSSFG